MKGIKRLFAEVYIATTHGLVSIQSITPLNDPDIGSVVTINQTSKLAGITQDYASFVSSPSGVIHEDFQHPSFRLNISDNISQGQSWQLGCYVAHALKTIGTLYEVNQSRSEFEPQASVHHKNVIIIATGVIDTLSKKVSKIESLPRKCLTANTDIQKWLNEGHKVIFLAPIDNLKDPIPDSSIQLTPIYELKELLSLFDALGLAGSSPKDDTDRSSTSITNTQTESHSTAVNGSDKSTAINRFNILHSGEQSSNPHRFFSKFNRNYIWVLSCFAILALVSVIFYSLYPKASSSLISVVTETGQEGRCTKTSLTMAFSQMSNAMNTTETARTFRVSPTSLNNLCGIRVITSTEINSILMVTDSKGLFNLSQNRIVKSDDVNLMRSYLNHQFPAQNELVSFDVPLPSNQSLTRTYYLVVSKYSFDAADIQSIEAELFKLYQTGRPISDQDIKTIISAIGQNIDFSIIYQSLTRG